MEYFKIKTSEVKKKSWNLNFYCTGALVADSIPVHLSRVRFKWSFQQCVWPQLTLCPRHMRKVSLMHTVWRRLQGEPCPGESAYSSIKLQERACWKLLVNRTSGNWRGPDIQVCEHNFPSPLLHLHLSKWTFKNIFINPSTVVLPTYPVCCSISIFLVVLFLYDWLHFICLSQHDRPTHL